MAAPARSSVNHRQRAYEVYNASPKTALRLLQRDMDDIRNRDGFRRAVVSVLREVGLLAPDPNPNARKPKLRLVPDADDQDDES